MVERTTSLTDAFSICDEVLLKATKGISDLVTVPGLVNLDFADVKAVMSNRGNALMGTGRASGPSRAIEAAQAAVSSPLLEDVSISGAEGVLVNITGGRDLTLHEVNEAATVVTQAAGDEANVIFGSVIDRQHGRRAVDHGDRDRLRSRRAAAQAGVLCAPRGGRSAPAAAVAPRRPPQREPHARAR